MFGDSHLQLSKMGEGRFCFLISLVSFQKFHRVTIQVSFSVLILIGKPVYYMEMLLGQFSSRGSIKVFDLSPAMRGIGYGQTMATGFATTYYASVMALTIRYFLASFNEPLPWSSCREEWEETCVSAAEKIDIYGRSAANGTVQSSAELYFL